MAINHDTLKAEWERLGKPAMEYVHSWESGKLAAEQAWAKVAGNPSFSDHNHYRFAGDKNWELRQKWLDSGKTLRLEVWVEIPGGGGGYWVPTMHSLNARDGWAVGFEFREAGCVTEGSESISTYTHPLQETFDAVIVQVTKGKGERHGGDSSPFFDQPWYSIAKQVGVGGLLFQAMKKAGEASDKPDSETFERELLGAIAYASMAYLYVKRNGFKPNDKAD